MKETVDSPRHATYVTGTRADYGLMRATLRAINGHSKLCLSILVTGMHLSEEFGNTIQDIFNDGFDVRHKVDMLPTEDTPAAMAKSIGVAIMGMTEAFEASRPDFVLLEGDRGESLAAAIAATHLNIAVAHISGGDVTGTMLDESIRHAITKFAHIHFPGTDASARRILRMGEDPWRVHMVGTPGSNLKGELRTGKEELAHQLRLNLPERLLLVLQHPVTTEVDGAAQQMRETMEAVSGLGEETVVIYPNSDAGGREMIKVIREYEALPFVHTFKSLPREAYVGLLSVTGIMLGNSSSALTDAPNFGLPAVNIGTRQQGRERGGNLTDVGHDREEIRRAIQYILLKLDDPAYRAKCEQSPYWDTNAAERIAEVLSTVELGPSLVQKLFYDGDAEDRCRKGAEANY